MRVGDEEIANSVTRKDHRMTLGIGEGGVSEPPANAD